MVVFTKNLLVLGFAVSYVGFYMKITDLAVVIGGLHPELKRMKAIAI